MIPAKMRKELGLEKGDKMLIDRREGVIILKPIVKLSRLKGIDRLEGASVEVDRVRKRWDREFDEILD
ncbi:MAG: AbrB/MazE/SpoVT family DNA-binding domain-containing protein [Archaeoglobus sp.]|nr:AbrB/MazE/SpoVT family DNA-binding domain-containing protein [Archaeoglobus sp.]